jgi:hypothetical protein
MKQAVKNPCTDVFCRRNLDFRFPPQRFNYKDGQYPQQDSPKDPLNWYSPSDCTTSQRSGLLDEDFPHNVTGEQIEQPDNSFNRLSSFIAATEPSMQFSAVLPVGGSAIASSSQPVPCSNSNSNSNNITSITNMNGMEHMGLVDGSTIGEGAMSLSGPEWCQ